MPKQTKSHDPVTGDESAFETVEDTTTMSQQAIEAQIVAVKNIYRQLTGSEPQIGAQPFAPIPPEVDRRAHIEENLRRLTLALQEAGLGHLSATAEPRDPVVSPRLNVLESETEWSCQVDLPGVDKADLSVQVSNGLLEIGARRRGITVDGFRPVYLETTPVRFARVVPLPPTVKTDVARATLDRGLLTVRLAKESVAPRRSVSVEVS